MIATLLHTPVHPSLKMPLLSEPLQPFQQNLPNASYDYLIFNLENALLYQSSKQEINGHSGIRYLPCGIQPAAYMHILPYNQPPKQKSCMFPFSLWTIIQAWNKNPAEQNTNSN
jgi:hypothetical protein